MQRDEMLYVFCYDVSSDRARRRVADILEDAAARVQKSVFEARMTRAKADRLARRTRRAMDPDDSLRVYAIGKTGLAHCRSYGGSPIAEAHDFYLF